MLNNIDYASFGGTSMKNVVAGVRLDCLLKALGTMNVSVRTGDYSLIAQRHVVIRNINLMVGSCKELPTMAEMYN